MESIHNLIIHPETGHQAPGSTSTFYTASPTLDCEVTGNRYIIAHHNNARWQIIREKLQEIAQGERTLKGILKTISFFVNDERFQSRYRRKRPESVEFMLDEFFSQLTEQKRNFYEKDLLPSIAKLILETEELFPLDQKISILRQYENQKIILSKRQCACLIAHMVFCIIVDQAHGFKLPELIDFSVIYSRPGENREKEKNITRKLHKIRCIFTYFEKVLSEKEKLEGNVVFERLFLEGTHGTHNEEAWEECEEKITVAEILSEGGIEDARDALQVVFSDNKLGDQVLQLPATQQQIMSLIHLELMISILFCEELESEETIRVYGAGRYSNYTGYSDTFAFAGPYTEDKGKVDRQHVIMDAGKYNSKQVKSQFDKGWVLRELKKAYSGFIQPEEENGRRVATGRWGCGVFKGNPQLKFIIQWLAASRAHRGIVFYTFEDAANFNVEEREKILNHYTGKEVKELYNDLRQAAMDMQIEKMKAETIQEEVMLAESEKKDEDKNLFKVLITLKGL